jgi:hypothetical protein
MSWAKFWAIFSQTHLVTLMRTDMNGKSVQNYRQNVIPQFRFLQPLNLKKNH